MKIDWNWWRHNGAVLLFAAALMCMILLHDPKVPPDWAHRAGLALGVIGFLWHVLFPHAQPLTDYLQPLEQGVAPFVDTQQPADPAKDQTS